MSVTAHETLEVVLFAAAGWRVGFAASHIRGARPAGGEARTGEIENLLGLPPCAAENRAAPQWLDLKQTGAERQILVDGPVELSALPVAAIHPLPPLLAARSTLHGLRALVLGADDRQAALLFDPPPSR